MLPTKLANSRDNGGDSTPDEDQGLIRCICDIDDDDGFTIQCENCLVWQHAVCVNIDQDNVPEEYLCEKCNPRKLDVKRAIDYQKRRMENEYKQSKDTRKRQRYAPAKGKRAEDGERRKRVSDSRPRTKPAKSGTGRESLSPTGMRTVDRQRDGVVPHDSNYTTIDRIILGADVQVLFQSVLSQLADQRNAVSSAAAFASTSAPSALAVDAVSATERGVNTPNGRTISHNTTNGDMRTPPPTDRTGDTSLPLMISINSEELNASAPLYRGLAGVDRGQTGLFARCQIKHNCYICEYKGHVILKAAYKEDPKNYYELLRTTRPYSQFHQEVDLCVDARRHGSEARFIRRSCAANVVLKSMCVVGSDDALIHLGLFAARDIGADEELTIGWEWDDGELPAVASMTPSDAEDYLARPEGRRMSKVWRQVFGGMACACPDAECDVRRLFAMLGVEESVARVESAGVLKRRASRPTKISAGTFDDGEMNGSPPPGRSPSGSGSLRGTHSRRGSGIGLQDSPASPLAVRGANSSDAVNNSRDALSLNTGQSLVNASTSRQSSADSVRAAAQQRQPDDDHSYQQSTNGQGGPRSRKRKPSAHLDGLGNGKSATISAPGSDCESTGSKKQRSVSSSSASRRGLCSDLPQKKLWINLYLEHAEDHEYDIAGAATAEVADPVASAVPADTETGTKKAQIDKAEVKVVVETKPASEEKSQSPKPSMEVDQAIVKSAPTDANAPTPSPSMSPTLASSAVMPDSSGTLAKLAVKDAPRQDLSPSQETQPEPTQKAESKPEPEVETELELKHEAAVTSPTKLPTTEIPAKKQRLSLAEYNKRRRGHTSVSGAKDSEGKPAAADLPSPQQKPEASIDVKLPESETSTKVAADTIRQLTPAPEQNGTQLPLLVSPTPMTAKSVDPFGRRSMISPPPPPPMAHMGVDDRPNGSSATGGRDHSYRFEREAAAYGPLHRARDRGRDSSGEREGGDVARRRDFRVRSQSRERGGRDRRYNSISGNHGHQVPTPARSATEWRTGGYAAGVGGMRALSMSPVQHPPPGSSGSAPGPSFAADDGGPHRSTARRTGSRGDSPSQR
ncbi:SET domain-containing protein 3 [Coemansia sp. RSA 1199]|nr:SET domain-containing protein 3 [Coemansia sp. RSA 1199]